ADRREDAGHGRARLQVRYRARVQLHPGQSARRARRRAARDRVHPQGQGDQPACRDHHVSLRPGAAGRRDVAGRARQRLPLSANPRRVGRPALGAGAAAAHRRYSLVLARRPHADARLRDRAERLLPDHDRPAAASWYLETAAAWAERLALPAAILPLASRAAHDAAADALSAAGDEWILDLGVTQLGGLEGFALQRVPLSM